MILLRLIFLIFLAGCLGAPNSGDEQANCPEDHTFNAVERKCFFSGGISPEGTLGLVETREDEDALINLDYIRVDNKQAISCRVRSEDQDVDYVSPKIIGIADRADVVADEARAAWLSIPNTPSFSAQKDSAELASQNADAAFAQLELASDTVVIVAALESLIDNALVAGQAAASIVENSETFVQGRIAIDEAEQLKKIKSSISDRCECSLGKCKTLARPRENFFGDSEFRYEIRDQLKRLSPVKEVINRVKSINDLPVATSFTVEAEETDYPITSDNPPKIIPFIVPFAKDVEDNINAAQFHYEITKGPSNGEISNCMGLGLDSIILSNNDDDYPLASFAGYKPSYQDLTCHYRPNDGDLSSLGVKAAFAFNGINFVAASPGEWGNDVQIEFLSENGIGANPKVFTDGRKITIKIEQGVTTAIQVFSALINDTFAPTLLDFETTTDLLATSLTSASFKVIQRTESLQAGLDPMDTIEYRVFDGRGYSKYSAVIGIKIQAESDPPRILIDDMVASPNNVLTIEELDLVDNNPSDDVTGVEILWDDPEGENLNSCTITVDPNIFTVLRDCDCIDTDPLSTTDLKKCTFLVQSLHGKVGSFRNGEITMRITSTDGLFTEQKLMVDVQDKPEPPLATFFGTGNFVESDDADPKDYSFSVPEGYDPDFESVSYSLVDKPLNGTLSNCLGENGTPNTDLDCVYTPDDGNLTALGRKASYNLSSLINLEAKYPGKFFENITVEIIEDFDIGPGKVFLTNTGLDFTIHLRPGTVQAQELLTVLQTESRSIYLHKLVNMSLSGPGGSYIMSGEDRRALIGGRNGADFFTYSISDGTFPGLSFGFVNIDIYPENDLATICQFSKYADAPECGINGCIGEESPRARDLTPSAVGLKYYQKTNGVCFISTGTTSSQNWEPVKNTDTTLGEFISNQQINEKDILVIDDIRIDEGGGSATADSCVNLDLDNVDENNAAPIRELCILGDDQSNSIRECSGEGSPQQADLDVTLDPAANIDTSEETIFFYDTLNNVCYVKTDTSWTVASNSDISNLSVDEDLQQVIIYDLDSSNTNLIPKENITFEWLADSGTIDARINSTSTLYNDDPTIAAPWIFGDNGFSDDRFPFRIKIQPQLGQIQDASSETSTISFKIADKFGTNNGEPVDIQFDVTVNAVAAIHNGWAKIQAFGPKTNKHDTVLDANKVCTFNRDMCNGGEECIGEGDPDTLNIVPDDNRTIYYDSNNDKCYFSNGLGDAATWVEFNSTCAISHSRDRSECGETSASCIRNDIVSPETLNDKNIVSTAINTFFYDQGNDVCYRSTAANSSTSWERYRAPGRVVIGWENFTIIGQASISGFNIYRRLAGEEFDYDRPINKELLSVTTNEYIDNEENSFYPPIPGTTYYYEVRPFVNGLLTGTNEIFNVVRVLVPPNNMVLVHRWMANLTMCKILNRDGLTVAQGGVDVRNNYRCAYTGPGNTFISDQGYYDFGKDLLVDRYETGCNYTASPACNGTFDNSCIGDEEPSSFGVEGDENAIYYNRSNGKCYFNPTAGNNWQEVNNSCDFSSTCGGGFNQDCTFAGDPNGNVDNSGPGSILYDTANDKCYVSTNNGTSNWVETTNITTNIDLSVLMTDANTSQNPPLVFVDQRGAATMCNAAGQLAPIVGVTENDLTKQLPSRKEHLIFSQWETEDLSANTIATMETGLSINSSSKCNSSAASGLESFFSDSPKPSSSVFYTLPGTNASQIRSLMTGSNGKNLNTFGTELCQSKFGVQDSIGNVSEWVVERMECVSGTECTAVSVGDPLELHDDLSGVTWKKNVTGSCPLIGSDDCDFGTPFDNFVATCEAAGKPADEIVNSVGADYLDTATGDCYKSVAIFRGTNDDMKVEPPPGTLVSSDIFRYQVFKLGGAPVNDSDNPDAVYYTGPCKDTNADDICDQFLDGWRFEEEKYDAGSMFVPMGLPVHRDFSFFSSNDLTAEYIAEIGPSSGITSANLHDDALHLNTDEIFADFVNCGSMAVGGGFNDGGDSGSYFFKFYPCTSNELNPNKAVAIIGDLSYKAKPGAPSVNVNYTAPDSFCSPINSVCNIGGNPNVACQGAGAPTDGGINADAGGDGEFYLDTSSGECYISSGGGTAWGLHIIALDVTINPGSNLIQVDFGMDEQGNVQSSAQDVHDAIIAERNLSAANDFFEVVVSGDPDNNQSGFDDNVVLENDLLDNKGVDIGFRCVVPVVEYAEDVTD